MIERVIISGGQTGADQAGWRAARAAGLRTGGMMPLGFLTEDGPRPEFATLYGAVEISTADYRMRTEANVRQADATIWFGTVDTPGAKATLHALNGMGKPHLVITPGKGVRPSDVAVWTRERGFKVLNVAGNRESKSPGIGGRVERFLNEVFRRLSDRHSTGP